MVQHGQIDYASLHVLGAAPLAGRYPSGDEGVFKRLAGAVIVRIGAPPPEAISGRIEGGGFIIDYALPGSDAVHRVVFAFNENGMWVVSNSYDTSCARPFPAKFTLTARLGADGKFDIKDDALDVSGGVAKTEFEDIGSERHFKARPSHARALADRFRDSGGLDQVLFASVSFHQQD